MASIERLPSGNYRIRVTNKHTGKRKSFTASTRAEVKRLAAEYEFYQDDTRDMTIEECIRLYVKDRSDILSPSTKRSYNQILENRLDDIKTYSAKKINSEDLQRWVNKITPKYSPKTVKNTFSLVSGVIRAFYPNKAINVRLPQNRPIERHLPTEEDVRNLLSNATPDLRKAILLASVGTLRRGEIAALTYGDIDGKVIHVHADIVQDENGEWVYKNIPKTSESDRYVEYPEEVIKQLGEGEPSERIVKYKTPDSITEVFTKLRNKLGLQCRFHDLRAYAASIMHSINVPDAVIMKRGGWKTPHVMQQCYRHALDDKMQEDISRTNEYMKRLLEP